MELAYLGGSTGPEIAGRQGVPLATVKGWLRLGLLALRRELGQLAPPRATEG